MDLRSLAGAQDVSVPPGNPGRTGVAEVRDTATLIALERLDASRQRLQEWEADLRESRSSSTPGSTLLRSLLSLGGSGIPWIKWGLSAFWLLRSLRRSRKD